MDLSRKILNESKCDVTKITFKSRLLANSTFDFVNFYTSPLEIFHTFQKNHLC